MAAASEPPMVEQVITELFAKSLHIILESRSPYASSRNFAGPSPPPSPLSGGRPRDRWFNLALRDCPAALENFDLWRQSNLEPLIIDIVLQRHGQTCTASAGGSKIVERWVIQYENRKGGYGNGGKNNGRKSRGSSADEQSLYLRVYKGSTVLLRSLYLVVRLLPLYNLFRELNSSGRIRPLSLTHKISSFVEPFTRAEDAELRHHAFAPIETLYGSLSLSVSYVPVLDVAAALEPTTPMPMVLIKDYFGSPTTDFIKRFQSLSPAVTAPACFVMTRPNSWSIKQGAGPSVSPSLPLPMYSEPRELHSDKSSCLQPRSLIHDNSLTACSHPHNASSSGQKKHTTSEERYPPLPTSPSPSHSPSVGQWKKPMFRCDSAPVNIPAMRAGGGRSGLPPTPCQKGKLQCSPQNDSLSARVPTADNKSNVKKDLIRLGGIEGEKSLQKVLSLGKDYLGYFRGLKLTRTSSKLFTKDESDDPKLVFVGDDRDTIIYQHNRAYISHGEEHRVNQEAEGSVPLTRSSTAAIGALVHMLKTAPGLRESLPSIAAPQVPQEPSIQRVVTEEADNVASSSAVVSSGLLRSRTAADALEDLKKYKDMKESILSRGGLLSRDTGLVEKPADGDC